MSGKERMTRSGAGDPRDHLDGGRFARPVLAKQSQNLARPHLETQVIHDGFTAVLLADSFDDDFWRHGADFLPIDAFLAGTRDLPASLSRILLQISDKG